MTSSPPLEAPHFRGKTLTPESPVPVHVPEPQNIPVLMNQTDIAFNDMSTHMEQRYPPHHPEMVESNGLQHQLSDMIANAIAPTEPDLSQSDENTLEGVGDSLGKDASLSNDLVYEDGALETEQEPNDSEDHLNAQPFVPHGEYENLSNHAKDSPTSFAPSQHNNPTAPTNQALVRSSDYSQTLPLSQGPAATERQPLQESDAHSNASASDVNGDGVNYQALLDNLSPSTSTAPISDSITSITTAAPPAPSSPSSAQTPIATLPIPAGLPPRPPPQEKPAIHPNYVPGEDIRSYHNPPAQISNAQANNPPRPPQGYNSNNGVAPNGLPPPPLASFQQPMSKVNQPQNVPQEAQNNQREDPGRNAGRPSISAEGEDEVLRRPDVEKLYEEFLRDEAIYVAEGTWDRFPQGSRLFVGAYFTTIP